MARVPYLLPETAPETVAGPLGKLPQMHVFQLMAHAETAFRPWLKFGGVLLNDLELEPALRELAVLQVGRLAARYEWEQHVEISQGVGVTQAQLEALDGGDLGPFDDLQQAVLVYVEALVAGDVDDATFAAVADRLTDREVVELTLVAAHYFGLARIMSTLRIDSDPPVDPSRLAELR